MILILQGREQCPFNLFASLNLLSLKEICNSLSAFQEFLLEYYLIKFYIHAPKRVFVSFFITLMEMKGLITEETFLLLFVKKVQRKIRTIFEREEVPEISSDNWRSVGGGTGVYPSLAGPRAPVLSPTPHCLLLFLPPTFLPRNRNHLDDHSNADEVPGKVEKH